MIQVKSSRYTYFSYDHDLVAWQVKLFDSFSENNFGMAIGIHLIIASKNMEIKSRDNFRKRTLAVSKVLIPSS